jgi:hypothetical protein
MDSVIKLCENLKLFNKNELEFKNLIGDCDKLDVLVDGKVKINDFNNGMLGNILEYEINLGNFLINQLDLSKTKSTYLDYIAETYFDFRRKKDETDAEFYIRMIGTIVDKKCTPIAILNSIQEFGTDIEMIEGLTTGAFADITFCDFYEDVNNYGINIVRAAFTEALGGTPYFFRIRISNLLPSNYSKIIERINDYKAGGINYIIEIKDIQQRYVGFTDLCFCDYDDEDFTVNPIVVRDFVS